MRGNKKYSILADHLGTPIEMYQDDGSLFWERQLNANGKTIKETQQGSCPFLFQGQYYDTEIELAYNRFRYYDVEDGRYISQDPIGLLSGVLNFYSYIDNPNDEIDPLGLVGLNTTGQYVYGLYDAGATEPYYIGITNDPALREAQHRGTERLSETGELRVLVGQDGNLTYAQARAHEQDLIETHKTKTAKRGEKISSKNRGNKNNSFNKNRKDKRGKAFKKAYNDIQKKKKHKTGYKK
ncbi:RHS repeat-associated core domain-containing protein [Flavobacterium branchiophilum]|uniref:RHS repeat domain-containing protein n=1 Tax=Flavobacterium branchiophilum TaxID=55197 RepID=UPI0006834669|nr:RHS repeat-associated core domain-containing protein [Flavobacterium branchiophilum]